MALYTTRLAGGSVPGTTFATVYTVPMTGVVVLRDVLATAFGGGSYIGLYIVPPGSGVPYWLLLQPVGVSNTLHLDCRQVLPPGAAVQVYMTGGSVCHYQLTGYVFAS